MRQQSSVGVAIEICVFMRELTNFFRPYLYRSVIIPALLCIFPDVSAQGFRSITNLSKSAAVKNTGDKPQSKVWNYDGKWWSVFSISTGTYIWRLDGTSWTNVLKISSSTTGKADCKALDNVCHILLLRTANTPSHLISVEYNQTSGTYELWSKRSAVALIDLDSGVETGTIDIDGTGRMWLASDGINDIRVRWSDHPYSTWSPSVVVETGVTDDDICAIIALPVQGQIGILWSDQNSKKFGFKTHNNGASPSAWSTDETPALQSALDIGKGMGDDHLNMALASDGTLYCAVKTSYDTPGYPRLALLKRLPSGSWDNLYEVSQSGTRGIVILNEAAGKLRVIYTAREDGGDILYQESSTSNISFSSPLTLIAGVYNNPTSSKANYDSDIVILASDTAHVVGVLGSDSTSLTVAISPPLPLPAQFATSVYPNPVQDLISLEFEEDANADLFVSISDPLGRTFIKTNTKLENRKMEIDLSELHLNSGLHLLIIKSEKHSQVIKFIKK